jgi:hypothetical protein
LIERRFFLARPGIIQYPWPIFSKSVSIGVDCE